MPTAGGGVDEAFVGDHGEADPLLGTQAFADLTECSGVLCSGHPLLSSGKGQQLLGVEHGGFFGGGGQNCLFSVGEPGVPVVAVKAQAVEEQPQPSQKPESGPGQNRCRQDRTQKRDEAEGKPEIQSFDLVTLFPVPEAEDRKNAVLFLGGRIQADAA